MPQTAPACDPSHRISLIKLQTFNPIQISGTECRNNCSRCVKVSHYLVWQGASGGGEGQELQGCDSTQGRSKQSAQIKTRCCTLTIVLSWQGATTKHLPVSRPYACAPTSRERWDMRLAGSTDPTCRRPLTSVWRSHTHRALPETDKSSAFGTDAALNF